MVSYILEHPKKVTGLTIEQLATVTFSSNSSIVRVLQEGGDQGLLRVQDPPGQGDERVPPRRAAGWRRTFPSGPGGEQRGDRQQYHESPVPDP